MTSKALAAVVLGLGLVVAGVWVATRSGATRPAAPEVMAERTSGVDAAAAFTVQLFKDPKPVPDFTVTTLDGRTITAASLRGKVVIVNFWATWCPPCREEVPDLVALQQKYGEQLVVLGLSTDEGASDKVRQFAEAHHINYPVAQVGEDMERLFAGVTGLPTSFIVDREGRIVQKHVGMLNARVTEQETLALSGLARQASIEYIEAGKPVGLENAAQAREIPGVDLASLSPDKRVAALQKLNSEPCACGCGLTVARCRVDDPQCSVSLPLAQKIVAAIAAGQ